MKAIILILIALLILGYFGLNLRQITSSPTFQDNWAFVKGLLVWTWDNILKTPVLFVWNSLIVPLVSSTSHKIIEQQASSTASVIGI